MRLHPSTPGAMRKISQLPSLHVVARYKLRLTCRVSRFCLALRGRSTPIPPASFPRVRPYADLHESAHLPKLKLRRRNAQELKIDSSAKKAL